MQSGSFERIARGSGPCLRMIDFILQITTAFHAKMESANPMIRVVADDKTMRPAYVGAGGTTVTATNKDAEVFTFTPANQLADEQNRCSIKSSVGSFWSADKSKLSMDTETDGAACEFLLFTKGEDEDQRVFIQHAAGSESDFINGEKRSRWLQAQSKTSNKTCSGRKTSLNLIQKIERNSDSDKKTTRPEGWESFILHKLSPDSKEAEEWQTTWAETGPAAASSPEAKRPKLAGTCTGLPTMMLIDASVRPAQDPEVEVIVVD
jgi:hypothetical protein